MFVTGFVAKVTCHLKASQQRDLGSAIPVFIGAYASGEVTISRF